MTEYAELEIGLHRQEADHYTIALRFSRPDSDADVRLGADTLGPARFNSEDLRKEVLGSAAYGQILTGMLFTDPTMRSAFAQARASAQSLNAPLRVRLFIGRDAVELHSLSWETLRDPEDNSLLCTKENILFSRYLSSWDWQPVRARPKRDLRALVVVANPSDLADYKGLAAIDADGEFACAKGSLGGISITALPVSGSNEHATLKNLIAHIRDSGCDIFYLVCHGRFARGEPWLWLENDQGKSERVKGDELVTRLADLQRKPLLIVLASCESAGSDETALLALGPRLVEAGVPAVLAMQGKVSLKTVTKFMPHFFKELQSDGQIDRAVAVARSLVRDESDYWMPVLFTRLRSGRLFAKTAEEAPFMAEELPDGFVPRQHEFEAVITHLPQDHNKPTTTALQGAGGYGKTTLAIAICHDERVQRRFRDGILWVTLGQKPNVVVGLTQIYAALTGERPAFVSIEDAAATTARALGDKRCLMVIDDVWNKADLRPFLRGGARCARLITTRNRDTIPLTGQTVNVDAMQPSEAVTLLSSGLPPGATQPVRALAARLGEWPLLLHLAHGVLRDRVRGAPDALPAALAYVNEALDKRGLTAFDARNPSEREQAIAKTLAVSLDVLTQDERARFEELTIFPEDVDVPLDTVARLWDATGGLDAFDTAELCGRVHGLSLLLRFDPMARYIRLHDVVHHYLTWEKRHHLRALHSQFLDAYGLQEWADLPPDEPYLWDHLAYHLRQAGREQVLVNIAKDLRYLATKAFVRGALAAEQDLQAATEVAPEDAVLCSLQRSFVQAGHLLHRCTSLKDLAITLNSRLQHSAVLAPLTQHFHRSLSAPYLIPWHPLPDLPHPAHVRTIVGHTGEVSDCAISADGTVVVSAAHDDTLKVWDAQTGAERLTLSGHTGVRRCAMSADGTVIVSASQDGTLRVWDGLTGAAGPTLIGTSEINQCAISGDGTVIVAACDDGFMTIWEAQSGREQCSQKAYTASVIGCAISHDGSVVVSASGDSEHKVLVRNTTRLHNYFSNRGTLEKVVWARPDFTLKVWDARLGVKRRTLKGHKKAIKACAMSADGTVIASVADDGTLKVWDAQTGANRLTLDAGIEFGGSCAMSADGATIVTAAPYGALIVWNGLAGTPRMVLQESHPTPVYHCAISANGTTIVSSVGKMLNVWHAQSETARPAPEGHNAWACAISTDGATLVTASLQAGLKVWDTQSGRERCTIGFDRPVETCAISGDGTTVVTGGGSSEVCNLPSGTTRSLSKDWVRCCAISADGQTIVIGKDIILKVLDSQSGAERLTLQPSTTNPVIACAISKDGAVIVSGSTDGTIKVWEARSGLERLSLPGHAAAVKSCTLCADSRFIASASGDNTIKLWDAHNGAELLSLRHDWVHTCDISPDKKFLSSVSQDGSLKVWDVHTGQCLLTLYVEGPLFDCVWFPDNQHVAATGTRGVYFWHLVR